MKIAELPNGDELYFPDDATDEAIDRAVSAYVGRGKVEFEIEQTNEPPKFFKPEKSAAEPARSPAIEYEKVDLSEIVSEVRLLRAVIQSGVSEVVKVMSAPKVLTRDERNRPVGVKPVI